MELKINQQYVHFDNNNLTIQEMLALYKPNYQRGIAVAINQTVIPQSDWATHVLNSSDQVLIITATQGG